MSEPAQKVKTINASFKQNYILKQFIACKKFIAVSGQGENLEEFRNIDHSFFSLPNRHKKKHFFRRFKIPSEEYFVIVMKQNI